MGGVARAAAPDHDDPLTLARNMLAATRDCSICGGSGKRGRGLACLCGTGKVHVYGPDVRRVAEALIHLRTELDDAYGEPA